jgi:hypothetical protein
VTVHHVTTGLKDEIAHDFDDGVLENIEASDRRVASPVENIEASDRRVAAPAA